MGGIKDFPIAMIVLDSVNRGEMTREQALQNEPFRKYAQDQERRQMLERGIQESKPAGSQAQTSMRRQSTNNGGGASMISQPNAPQGLLGKNSLIGA